MTPIMYDVGSGLVENQSLFSHEPIIMLLSKYVTTGYVAFTCVDCYRSDGVITVHSEVLPLSDYDRGRAVNSVEGPILPLE